MSDSSGCVNKCEGLCIRASGLRKKGRGGGIA